MAAMDWRLARGIKLTSMLNRSEGTSWVKSLGFWRSCHKRDGVVTPPAKRQLTPTTAMGSDMGFGYGMMPKIAM